MSRAEGAAIKPGHSRAIDQKGSDGGVVYLDDFDGSSTPIHIRTPIDRWVLASIPQGQPLNFPEATLTDSLVSGVNRAKIAWYSIDQSARSGNDDSYTRVVRTDELFPNKQRQAAYTLVDERTFDITYFPQERGPYNFDLPNGYQNGGNIISAGVDNRNKLKNPSTRWAGIMRYLNTNDFEQANVEYIEFWMLSPFLPKAGDPAVTGDGVIQIHLGNLSEDIFKDARQQYENGLPTGDNQQPTELTAWGRISTRPPLISNTFDNNNREEQDLGFDGLDNAGEEDHFANYIDSLRDSLDAVVFQDEVLADPANDDFIHYLDPSYSSSDNAIDRYFAYNNPQGKFPGHPEIRVSSEVSPIPPDREDLNDDESLNEAESYFLYEIPVIRDGSNATIDRFNTPYITDTITTVSSVSSEVENMV